MVMGVTIIEPNLSELESNIRRDAESYLQDFETQYENYMSLEATYLSAPSEYVPKLNDLLVFLSQVIHLYPNYAPKFSENVTSALLSRSFGMNAHMRMAYLKAFMRMRTRNFLTLQQSVDVAFRLHRCQDKQVRKMLRGFVIADMKRSNSANNSPKANAVIQSFLAKAIKDSNCTLAKEAVILLTELFRRNIWKNEKCLNLIADACLAKSKKVYAKAVRFFLGHNEKAVEHDSGSGSDDDVNMNTRIKQMKLGHRVGAKTNKRAKRLDRSIDNLKRKTERKAKEQLPAGINVLALNMIYDPQTFAEKLFHKLEKCNDRLEIRLLLLELISHLIGVHQLLLLNFYASMQRFLRPQQREITRLLLFAAQASHDQVPPDAIGPMVRTIVDNFVTDRASAEAITVGLNTIREICARCPYALDADLLSDLIGYKSYRNKNVVAAARSLIRLYRQVNPALLPRREIGRPTEAIKEALGLSLDLSSVDVEAPVLTSAADGPALAFGRHAATTVIPGAEVLLKEFEGAKKAHKRKATCCEHNVSEYESGADQDEPGAKRRRVESSSSCCDHDHHEEEEEDREEGGDSEIGFEDITDGCDAKSGSTDDDDEAEEGEVEEVAESKEEPENVTEATATKKKKKGKKAQPSIEDILTSRVLTDEDIEAIRKRQAEKQTLFAATGGRKRKRGNEVVIDEADLPGDGEDSDGEEKPANPEEAHGLVSMRSITKLVKRAHSTKADRMESIAEGREGRKAHGFKVNRMNPNASTTNREKRKGKTFQMIKHKVRRKATKRSFQEKQSALREHLKKMSRKFRH